MTIFARIVTIGVLIALASQLSGCGFANRHFFQPASQLARVDPLFRTQDCATYDPSGAWETINPLDIFLPNKCEGQVRSVNVAAIPDKPAKAACEGTFDTDELQYGQFRVRECVAYLVVCRLFSHEV